MLMDLQMEDRRALLIQVEWGKYCTMMTATDWLLILKEEFTQLWSFSSWLTYFQWSVLAFPVVSNHSGDSKTSQWEPLVSNMRTHINCELQLRMLNVATPLPRRRSINKALKCTCFVFVKDTFERQQQRRLTHFTSWRLPRPRNRSVNRKRNLSKDVCRVVSPIPLLVRFLWDQLRAF